LFKDHSSALAQNHAMLELGQKPFTAIMFGDFDFMLTASDFGDMAAYGTILARLTLCMYRNSYS